MPRDGCDPRGAAPLVPRRHRPATLGRGRAGPPAPGAPHGAGTPGVRPLRPVTGAARPFRPSRAVAPGRAEAPIAPAAGRRDHQAGRSAAPPWDRRHAVGSTSPPGTGAVEPERAWRPPRLARAGRRSRAAAAPAARHREDRPEPVPGLRTSPALPPAGAAAAKAASGARWLARCARRRAGWPARPRGRRWALPPALRPAPPPGRPHARASRPAGNGRRPGVGIVVPPSPGTRSDLPISATPAGAMMGQCISAKGSTPMMSSPAATTSRTASIIARRARVSSRSSGSRKRSSVRSLPRVQSPWNVLARS